MSSARAASSTSRRLALSMLTWFGTIEYVILELALGIIAFLGVSDVFYVSPFTLRALYIVGAVLNGIGLAFALMRLRPTIFAVQAGSLYFLRTFGGHLLLALLAIVYCGKFGDLDVLSFDTNAGPFSVYRAIHIVNLLHFMIVSYGIVADMRYNGVVAALSARGRTTRSNE